MSAPLLLLVGCSDPPAARYVYSPTYTYSEVRPTPAPASVVVASPNLSVAADLVAACKLNFDDSASAPKFAFDSSGLGPEDSAVLSQIAKCVTTGPLAGRGLRLVGRADPRGGNDYNMALGARRAASVASHLAGLGVPAADVEQSSRGNLDATGDDEASWQTDRRVDIHLANR